MTWLKKLFTRSTQRIPDLLWQDSLSRLAFVSRLSNEDQARLKALAETLLATKRFTGAGGLVMSDEIAVLIAAQAALPILNLTLDLYDDLHDIFVYPSEFIVPHVDIDEAGVVHEWHEPIAGEALDAGGAIVLSWEDVESGQQGNAGFNVLIHEFVHKIDMQHGEANGRPPFLAEFHQGLHTENWQREFSVAYADFAERVEQLESQLPDDTDADDPAIADKYDEIIATLPLDPYAATHPAEFFAVAAEAFFVRPGPLAATYPQIYQLLQRYFRQNTLPGT